MMRLGTLDNNISDQIRTAIVTALPGAEVSVQGGGGHFSLEVTHEAFAGKGIVAQQRLVLGAIKHLMSGEAAPVHAVDSLKTHPR